MWLDGFEPAADAPSEWDPGVFGDRVGIVGTYVPRTFEAFVRLLHPVDFGGSREPVGWAEYAEAYGTVIHPEVQWHRLIRSDDPNASADNGALPRRDVPGARFFGQVLNAVTGGAGGERVSIGFWPGHGLGDPGETPLSEREREAAYSREGWREAYWFRGPVEELRAAVDAELDEFPELEWPNVTWPEDHSWFIFSEIDFDSTVVGCSAEAAKRLLGDERLEALVVGPNSDLTCYGDTIN